MIDDPLTPRVFGSALAGWAALGLGVAMLYVPMLWH
jgi:hypothetical protein